MLAQRLHRGVRPHVTDGARDTGAWREDVWIRELARASDPPHKLGAAHVVGQIGVYQLDRDGPTAVDLMAEEDARDRRVAQEAVHRKLPCARSLESRAERNGLDQSHRDPPSWSSARLSSSTLTLDSPRTPSWRPSVWTTRSARTWTVSSPRAFATRAIW